MREFLMIFEEIVLEGANQSSLLEFLLRVDRLAPEVGLLYNLLLAEESGRDRERSWQDFDYRWLNSEYILYKEVLKAARFNDSAPQGTRPLLLRMAGAVLRPVLSILQEVLFEACSSVEFNSEAYLKHYFHNYSDLLALVSRKMELIKSESH